MKKSAGEVHSSVMRSAGLILLLATGPVFLPLSKQEDVDYARYIISIGDSISTNQDVRTTVFAYVAPGGGGGINRNYLDPKFPEWSWHLRQFIAFGQLGAELLDGGPTLLERYPEWYRGEISSESGPNQAHERPSGQFKPSGPFFSERADRTTLHKWDDGS